MNIALTKIYAAASANFCVGSSFVRPLILGCALACAVPAAMAWSDRDQDGQRNGPAQAQAGRELPRGERMQPLQAPQPRQYEVGRSDQPAYDARAFEARAEEQRRQIQIQQEQAAHNDAGRRSGRLTADERRDLRRQINEAGMDLYPNTPRR